METRGRIVLVLCSAAALLVAGCTKAEKEQSTPADAGPASRPAATPEPVARPAPEPEPDVEAALPDEEAIEQFRLDYGDDVANMGEKLQGLQMAADFLGDEPLRQIIEPMAEKIETAQARLLELAEAAPEQAAALMDEITALVDEIKEIDRQARERVKEIGGS